MYQVGSIAIKNALLLAPMEDVTDISFRILCRELGADVVFTEFVNSDGLTRNCKRAAKKMELLEEERPIGIQIYGQHIDSMIEATRMAEQREPEMIDINAGCWVKKVAGRGAGAGLLKDPDYMEEMVRAIVQTTDLPVTVKTRLGWDLDSIVIEDVAKRIEDAGAKALTLHCRTRSMGHSGEPLFEYIQRVKEKVDMPVVVNGGIMEAEDVVRVIDETNADGIMIARGAIGRPWIFKEAKGLMENGVKPEIDLKEKVDLLLRHLELHIELKGERRAIPSFRKYYAGYLKGLYGAGKLRKELVVSDDLNFIRDKIVQFAENYGKEAELVRV